MWGALRRKRSLHLQCHAPVSQRVVGVCGHGVVRHQLAAVSEVPHVVDGRRGLQEAAGVVELDAEHHVSAAVEDVWGLSGIRLLRDADGHWDLI